MLEQSDLKVGLPTLCLAALCLGIVLALLLAIATKHWWSAPIGLAVGILVPLLYVRLKYRLRMRRLGLQLPEAFDAIGRAVRAGQTIAAAFQIVGDDFEPPISAEFRRCYEEQNLGMPHETAWRNLAARTGFMEMRILVVALLVQSRSGGNLIELLSNLSMMVRKRVKLQQKVKAITGEGRMQATVLIVLPVLAFLGLLVVSPSYAASLLERPWLLVVAGTAQLLGAVWIRHIINFEF